MYRLLRFLLFLLPAEAAHHLGIGCLKILSRFPGLCSKLRHRALGAGGVDLSTTVAGIRFPNPVCLAAGFDKDAVAIPGLFALGFGGVEVGTLTPRPQPGNEKPRIFRIPEQQALINRLGFNNGGVKAGAERVRALAFRPAPVGINIGKNKDTPLEQAEADYLACIDAVAGCADYVVINASSPNTPGLRALQEPERLLQLVQSVKQRLASVSSKPLFLKIAPDLEPEAIDEIVDVALQCRLDGLIATNTTVQRPFEHPASRQSGGLSGLPLKSMSTQVVARAYARAAGRLPIIGVGGIFSAEDAYEKIRAGASLVQVYTGFIYGGPDMPKALVSGLARLLARDGFSRVSDAVGADARPAASTSA
jgi:dihydroorotate dehydrogenase